MRVKSSETANLTIDLRRSRFRIYKQTLELLGNPAYIQFLINPEDLFIAILGSDRPMSGGTSNRVTLSKAGKSVEFYSTALLDGIFKIYGVLDCRYSYHLSGEIDKLNRVAYFSLRSITKVNRGAKDGGKRLSETQD